MATSKAGAGQRTNQLRVATDRKMDLDPARGQVPLHVRRLAGALDPDRPLVPGSVV
jgi:hypothetical protein